MDISLNYSGRNLSFCGKNLSFRGTLRLWQKSQLLRQESQLLWHFTTSQVSIITKLIKLAKIWLTLLEKSHERFFSFWRIQHRREVFVFFCHFGTDGSGLVAFHQALGGTY